MRRLNKAGGADKEVGCSEFSSRPKATRCLSIGRIYESRPNRHLRGDRLAIMEETIYACRVLWELRVRDPWLPN